MGVIGLNVYNIMECLVLIYKHLMANMTLVHQRIIITLLINPITHTVSSVGRRTYE